MDAIAESHHATRGWQALLARLAALMAERGAHPARTVVLVPYAQLMPLARQLWAGQARGGFSPRFETTLNWAGRTAFAPGPLDLSFDQGRDLLAARGWLERAGLGPRHPVLAGRLVEAAWQAAGCAAAVPPACRAEWALQARQQAGLGLEHPSLALEAAVVRIAIEWAAASAYATDELLAPQAVAALDLLLVLQGLQPDPVAAMLADQLGAKAVTWLLDDTGAPPGTALLHEAPDAADEAERAAACVLGHLGAGRVPVALAAIDRVAVRRIRAVLSAHGVAVRDETGWKLSTTRAAAAVMALLSACAWDAGSDAVIDWLKHAPAVPPGTVSALERRVRAAGVRDWQTVDAHRLGGEPGGWSELIERANAWRTQLREARGLTRWQQALRAALQDTGQWAALQADSAGQQLVLALGLDEGGDAHWSQLPQAGRRLDLAAFTRWVSDTLEAATYTPEAPEAAQVVILPFNQLLGRPFAALVLPGCDELRLPVSPQPAGPWTAAQRAALGLPAREALEQAVRAGWRNALRTPWVDVLVRRTDDSGESLLPSPLVQQLLLAGGLRRADDPRQRRPLAPAPVARPRAVAPALPVQPLSASAYEDLRRCPYRYFALRQLGLHEPDEIDAELDKRDFGIWLHAVLDRFHAALRDQAPPPGVAWRELLDRLAHEVRQGLGLPAAEFLPFQAVWPRMRDGYLRWLQAHLDGSGARFESAEAAYEMALGHVRLAGRIDRVDRLPDGTRFVLDYKTESLERTRQRVKAGHEDTQLAFYGALLADDTLRVAYVNVGEDGTTTLVEHSGALAARDALVEGLLEDVRRIEAGAAMQALGEGAACEHCAARGLCRKDFWHG